MNIDQSHGSDDVNDRLSQVEAQIRACFLMFCRDLDELMDTKSAVASNPTVDSGPRITTSDQVSDHQPEETPEEPRMIGDFDGSANEFWKLFRDEAKSHDDARINTLKEGMDSALIFVRSYSVRAITNLVVLMCGPSGWLVFCCSHSIRSRQQTRFDAQPCRRSSVLPPTTFCHPLPDFRATILNRPTDSHSFHSAASFPCI
jgi:hypothetical protein